MYKNFINFNRNYYYYLTEILIFFFYPIDEEELKKDLWSLWFVYSVSYETELLLVLII